MMPEFLSSFFLWLVYYAGHSLLALDQVKAWSLKHWSYHNQYYRLCYNLWAGAGLLGILAWMKSHSGPVLMDRQLIPGAILSLVGFIVIYLGVRKYHLGVFLGFTQWKQPKTLEAHEMSPLVTEGLQNYIRHPLYTGTLLFLSGWFLLFADSAHLAWLLATIIYLPAGIYLEEKKLIRMFGDAYVQYKKRTNALWPKINASKN